MTVAEQALSGRHEKGIYKMYLTRTLVLNSSALSDLELNPEFNEDSSPKPIVLVGPNGSGKTTLLAIIADALIEIAAQKHQGVTPTDGMVRKFFRLIGGRSSRLGSAYEFVAAKFAHAGQDFYFRSKAGNIQPADLADRLSEFRSISNWPDNDHKFVIGPVDKVRDIYTSGAYVFFPVTRFESPHWANLEMLDRDPIVRFETMFASYLPSQIIVESAFGELKSWILGLLADSNLSAQEALGLPTLDEIRNLAIQKMATAAPGLSGLGSILTTIMKKPAWIARMSRGHGDRRLCIASGHDLVVPTFENLSSGQTSLLAMFGTILRYADWGQMPRDQSKIEGIVLVDEIDAHLHADLQYEALPALLKMFPRVQFIVTSHSPLFPLGMQRTFGDDGFSLIEVPGGVRITPERFSEFTESFRHFQSTKAFEQHIQQVILKNQRPLVLCEGETDPIYLKTAADLLSYTSLETEVDFEWIGNTTASGHNEGGGAKNLDNALKFLKNNPKFIGRKTVLLYDCDTNKPDESHNDVLFVRSLRCNSGNTITDKGIENLLPNDVFEEQFFHSKEKKEGARTIRIKDLRKMELCKHLCESSRHPLHFVGFIDILKELCEIFQLAPGQNTAGNNGSENST